MLIKYNFIFFWGCNNKKLVYCQPSLVSIHILYARKKNWTIYCKYLTVLKCQYDISQVSIWHFSSVNKTVLKCQNDSFKCQNDSFKCQYDSFKCQYDRFKCQFDSFKCQFDSSQVSICQFLSVNIPLMSINCKYTTYQV